jgi:hypothetical protein
MKLISVAVAAAGLVALAGEEPTPASSCGSGFQSITFLGGYPPKNGIDP